LLDNLPLVKKKPRRIRLKTITKANGVVKQKKAALFRESVLRKYGEKLKD
jgi:hypothetical protein